MQADSKIILAGSLISYDGVAVNNVCRINPDGSFDNTFDSGSGTDGGGSPIVVGLQADNKLIIRGGFTSYDGTRSEDHTSELQSRQHFVCCLLVEKNKVNR